MRRFLAPAALLLAAPLLPLLVTAPAQAANGSLTTSYTCDSPYGGGTSKVTISAKLPSTVKAGSQVDARKAGFSVTVPEKMVAMMRQYGVTAMSGSATGAKYRVGAKKVAIKNVKLPKTKVPASGAMVLKGSGIAGGFVISKPGTYAVKVPTSFTAKVTAYTSQGNPTANLSCSLVKGAPATMGSITVR